MENKMKGKVFTAQEVQAMLNGSKVMFREVIKPQPFQSNSTYQSLSVIRDCPYQVGQKIFCKESFAEILYASDSEYRFGKKIIYRAEDDSHIIWKPAQHMKQEHSRLTLLIKEIRVEKLAEISADDCWKEGIAYSPECCQNYIAIPDCNGNPTPSCCNNPNVVHPQPQFEQIWNATHKKLQEKFDANPWVWVLKFELVKNNL